MTVPSYPTKIGQLVKCIDPIPPLEKDRLYRISGEVPFLFMPGMLVHVEADGRRVPGGPYWRWRFEQRGSY